MPRRDSQGKFDARTRRRRKRVGNRKEQLRTLRENKRSKQ